MKGLLGLIVVATLAVAQVRTIGAGTTISVRTNETIDVKKSDGRVFTGVVDQDVTDAKGSLAIARGSNAELIVRKAANDDLTLDLESVTVNGQRYAVTADASRLSSEERDGIGKNRRTGEYIGGGAALGAIIGAIAGGGKGAAIGAAAGAGAGACAQIPDPRQKGEGSGGVLVDVSAGTANLPGSGGQWHHPWRAPLPQMEPLVRSRKTRCQRNLMEGV